MADAFIYDAVRTPRGRGRPDGALRSVTPVSLIETVLRSLEIRVGLDTDDVEDVILGCVEPIGEQGYNIARIAALVSGYSERVPGVQINRFCASGLEACNMAASQIMSGQCQLVVAGGVESMSRIPIGSSGGAWFTDPKVIVATHFVPQGISADLLATVYGLSRQEVDAYAVSSQQRAAQAWRERRFDRSIVAVADQNGSTLLERDEHMRPETTLETLGRLSPSFAEAGQRAGFDGVAIQRYPELQHIDHVHHAGNSSGIVDGAAAVLIGSREAGRKLGKRPRARIRSFASVGSEPTIMLTGPMPAATKALRLSHMQPNDLDLVEVNEAFAAVPLAFMRDFGVTPEIVNVNGGAIAMGHPLGATGAMLLGTALDELERSDKTTALVTLCVGAGMGTATVLERL